MEIGVNGRPNEQEAGDHRACRKTGRTQETAAVMSGAADEVSNRPRSSGPRRHRTGMQFPAVHSVPVYGTAGARCLSPDRKKG